MTDNIAPPLKQEGNAVGKAVDRNTRPGLGAPYRHGSLYDEGVTLVHRLRKRRGEENGRNWGESGAQAI